MPSLSLTYSDGFSRRSQMTRAIHRFIAHTWINRLAIGLQTFDQIYFKSRQLDAPCSGEPFRTPVTIQIETLPAILMTRSKCTLLAITSAWSGAIGCRFPVISRLREFFPVLAAKNCRLRYRQSI